MKVQELRELLKAADREFLEKAFVESYKHFTKSQKEEADQIIKDILSGISPNKAKKKTEVSFENLKQEILVFIENARAQNYMFPNRVIPKNQRPKWRFLVKNFLKELEKISQENENYGESVNLLVELYRLISDACNYVFFSTDDAFRSIGWKQEEFFQLVAKRVLGIGYTRENISRLILYASTGGLSAESLHVDQQIVLLSELKTTDAKYMALEEAKKLIDENVGKLGGLKEYATRKYALEDTINNLCDMVLMIHIVLAELEEGISYYFKANRQREREIILYKALSLAEWLGEDDIWIQIYEYGIKKNIKPRDSLVREYQERKDV
ncbi:hypothetical protein D7V86_19675 [bacterium D16-51]|nr:hypothetical protein D7V96_03505 [bacterium D16-59]RKI56311.1 hypothetical protein D7V86_19675 [bacterium D16-51]